MTRQEKKKRLDRINGQASELNQRLWFMLKRPTPRSQRRANRFAAKLVSMYVSARLLWVESKKIEAIPTLPKIKLSSVMGAKFPDAHPGQMFIPVDRVESDAWIKPDYKPGFVAIVDAGRLSGRAHALEIASRNLTPVPIIAPEPLKQLEGLASMCGGPGYSRDHVPKCKHENVNSSDGCDECLDCGIRNY